MSENTEPCRFCHLQPPRHHSLECVYVGPVRGGEVDGSIVAAMRKGDYSPDARAKLADLATDDVAIARRQGQASAYALAAQLLTLRIADHLRPIAAANALRHLVVDLWAMAREADEGTAERAAKPGVRVRVGDIRTRMTT